MTTVQAVIVALLVLACAVNGTRAVILRRRGDMAWRRSASTTALFVLALAINAWVLATNG